MARLHAVIPLLLPLEVIVVKLSDAIPANGCARMAIRLSPHVSRRARIVGTHGKIVNNTSGTAFISLGSNCRQAEAMLARARDAVAALAGVHIAALSPVYATEPQDYAEQPWFLNQVLRLALGRAWHPVELLEALLGIETALGRVRPARADSPALRFGPRAIDLDLLLFDTMVSQDPRCILPHPRMLRRAFVLVPLLDIAPGLRINGVDAAAALAALPHRVAGGKIFQ